MFVFCYLLVPIFNIVCKQWGINGKSVNAAAAPVPGMQVDKSRTIKIEFTTTVHGSLKFKFIPLHRHIEIHPGETKLFISTHKIFRGAKLSSKLFQVSRQMMPLDS